MKNIPESLEEHFYAHMGRELQTIRLQRKITIHQAARGIRSTYQTIQRIESGTSASALHLYVRLCHLYIVDLGQLVLSFPKLHTFDTAEQIFSVDTSKVVA